ncbi:MAG: hypothetical protein Q9183_006156, partial [Haloplaca sp. 2 TL-2023]
MYRDWAWDAFVAVNTTCRVKYGFSSISDVNVPDGGEKKNFQESFLFGEVLKYSYMIQRPNTNKEQDLYTARALPVHLSALKNEGKFLPISPRLRQALAPQPQVKVDLLSSLAILLVPTTEVLLTSKDRETNAPYSDLSTSEEFLASHVIRITGAQAPGNGSIRDSRGKAKQYTTVNGRTVIVKESAVYSNKGFRNINQAQLLSDVLYYPDQFEAQQWLIYYISRPLIGSWEPVKITPAILPTIVAGVKSATPVASASKASPTTDQSSNQKKHIASFSELLNQFPMIARQMQQGLERVFKEFHRENIEHTALLRSRASSKAARR